MIREEMIKLMKNDLYELITEGGTRIMTAIDLCVEGEEREALLRQLMAVTHILMTVIGVKADKDFDGIVQDAIDLDPKEIIMEFLRDTNGR